MELLLIFYFLVAIGFYVPVAASRGRIVGVLSALIWPLIMGMNWAWRALEDDKEFQVWMLTQGSK